MTSVAVKGVNSLVDASVSAKTNVQSDAQPGNFDDTLNNMRAEKRDSSVDNDEVRVKKTDDRAERFDKVGHKNQVKAEEEVTEEQMAAMSDEVMTQIKEVLMEKYNISEEELNMTLENLGMDEMDLLNLADLTQVVMKLEGIENQADMLTNPEFAKNLKDILSQVEEIKENVKLEDISNEDAFVVEVNTGNDKEVLVTDEDSTNENDLVKETTAESEKTESVQQTTEQVATTENEASNQDNQHGLLKHDDKADEQLNDSNISDNVMVAPEEFAKKLTEDLSVKVGETKANDIVRQVVEQTQIHVKQGATSLEMQLYPEHLGKVLVQVVSHEGSITAQITAESEAAKNALESQLTLLKENLNNQGVKVENVEVTIASHAFEQNMQGEGNSEQNSSNGRKSRRSTSIFFDGANNEEQTVEEDKEIMELKGSTVSYSA